MESREIAQIETQIDKLKNKILIAYKNSPTFNENILILTADLHTLIMKYKTLKRSYYGTN